MPKYDILYIDIIYKEPEKRIIPLMIKYATIFKSTENILLIILVQVMAIAGQQIIQLLEFILILIITSYILQKMEQFKILELEYQ